MNVMVVDSDLAALARTLDDVRSTHLGRAIGFSHGADALCYASTHRVNTVILESYVDGVGGLELAKKLRALLPDIAIVFLSDSAACAPDSFSVQAKSYLLKPVSRKDLKAALEKTLP